MNDEVILAFIQDMRQFQGEIRQVIQTIPIISEKLDTHISDTQAHGESARWSVVSRLAIILSVILSGVALVAAFKEQTASPQSRVAEVLPDTSSDQ